MLHQGYSEDNEDLSWGWSRGTRSCSTSAPSPRTARRPTTRCTWETGWWCAASAAGSSRGR